MSIEEYNILDRFYILFCSKFFSALGKDAYGFLIACKDKLHNLCLVETCCLDYTTFQLDVVARH